jgi:hypothetical protein
MGNQNLNLQATTDQARALGFTRPAEAAEAVPASRCATDADRREVLQELAEAEPQRLRAELRMARENDPQKVREMSRQVNTGESEESAAVRKWAREGARREDMPA